MELMDTLKTVGSFIGIGEKKEGTGNFLIDIIKKLGGEKETKEVIEKAKEERAGVFTETISSVLTRYFPLLSKITTVASLGLEKVGLRKRSPEAHSFQNELDNFLAFTIFIDDDFLVLATDPLVKSGTFLKVVEEWPQMPKKMIDKIKMANYDPDDVINVLRVMSQDISTGKVVADKLTTALLGGTMSDILKQGLSILSKSPNK